MKLGAFIIPTGVGASIGGFAGDASKWARRLAQKCKLIVNPNVVNAAIFSGITENMLYVEGYTLDDFFKGKCHLKETKNNRIGVIFDKAIPGEVINININAINAIKNTYDINVTDYVFTSKNVGVEFFVDNSGISMGNIRNLDTIEDAAKELISIGCNALAIVCFFPEEQGDNYANGIGVDPVGGVEAIISHYISKQFSIPCAHAPAFADYTIGNKIVDPRCAAEYITPTFLPSILIGLANAPQISKNDGLSIEDLDFLVTPYNSLGGIPMLEMSKRGGKIYAIRENNTVLDVTPNNFTNTCDIIKTYDELMELL